MPCFRGPAPPSPAIGDALNAGYAYLDVMCRGRNTHQTVVFDIVRRPESTPVYELELLYVPALCLQKQPIGRAAQNRNAAAAPRSKTWSGDRD